MSIGIEFPKTYLLVDSMNLLMRCRHHTDAATPEERVQQAIHIAMSSINASFRKFECTDLVVAAEGRSWRKAEYVGYKANRVKDAADQTEDDKLEMELLFKTLEEFLAIVQASNAIMIRHSSAEADDMIARFIELNPDAQHVLVSTDSDFIQLVRDNVLLVDPIKKIYITPSGVHDEKLRRLKFEIGSNGKIKVDKQILKESDKIDVPDEWWKFALFVKCVKGDATDNIFTAYPGVRMKSSSKKIGLIEAFGDRHAQGFTYLNFMNQKWEDPEGNHHLVKDGFERNQQLIDLTAQPEEFKILFDEAIRSAMEHKGKQIAFEFMKFCGKYKLEMISQKAPEYIRMFSGSGGPK